MGVLPRPTSPVFVLDFPPSKFCPPCHPVNAFVPLPAASIFTSPQLGQYQPSECLEEVEAAPPKKRKADTDATEPVAKKTKKTEENGEEDEDKDEEAENEAPEDDADEQEQEEDEPAVKTKVVKGSESKTAAAEAETEHLDDED